MPVPTDDDSPSPPRATPSRRRRRGSAHTLADRYRFGEFDHQDSAADAVPDEAPAQRFTSRSKHAQQSKILRTALQRASEPSDTADIATLPIGQVWQVYSLYTEVMHENQRILCVVRKTLSKVADTAVVVGDRVRFREITTAAANLLPPGAAATTTSAPPTAAAPDATAAPAPTPRAAASPASSPPPLAGTGTAVREGVIEQILPRDTVLTRTDSFKSHRQHPIVANAQQMLIVASARLPEVKWGLIDRMLAAARSGKLLPIVCLNKIDLLDAADRAPDSPTLAPLHHYAALGIPTLQTTINDPASLAPLRDLLQHKTTVLAGHSGVGKSSLIRALQPSLDIRIGAVSHYTAKGRHTTTSARRYELDFGGAVIDTPGVKHFGLWGVTRETLIDFFPDIADHTAPPWRRESYERILSTLS